MSTKDTTKVAISLEEARQKLGISRALIYKMAKGGRIRTINMGRRKLVPLKEMERLLDEGIEERPGGTHEE